MWPDRAPPLLLRRWAGLARGRSGQFGGATISAAHLQAALPVPVEVALDAAGVPLLHNLVCGVRKRANHATDDKRVQWASTAESSIQRQALRGLHSTLDSQQMAANSPPTPTVPHFQHSHAHTSPRVFRFSLGCQCHFFPKRCKANRWHKREQLKWGAQTQLQQHAHFGIAVDARRRRQPGQQRLLPAHTLCS